MSISIPNHSSHPAGNPAHVHHVTPTKTLLTTLGILILLTIITVTTSRYDFARLNGTFSLLKVDLHFINILLAMGIACVKMSLVIALFMGLKYDKPFLTIVFLSSFIFLGIFMVYTLTDTLFRGLVNRKDAITLPFESPVKMGTGEANEHAGDPAAAEHP